jgi:alkylation response protein AidB-like acyl-CoA dehydrogenase
MNFAVSSAHEQLRSTLRAFLEREAPPDRVAEWDRAEEFPSGVYMRMADLGLCGMSFAEEYGGTGADGIAICVAAEELARASATLAWAFIPTVTFCARGIARFGSDQQRRALLPEIAAGRLRLAMGLTEPDVGSDLTHLSTRAVRDGADFVVSGQKVFTTGADTCDYIFTFVRTNQMESTTRALSVLLVPRMAIGVTTRALPKLAGQGTHTCEVWFDGVRVPADNLVGELNGGAAVIFDLLDGERICTGALGIGIAQGALDCARRHALEHTGVGGLTGDRQAIGHALAEMTIEVEMARLLVWRAAWMLDQGCPCSMEAAMAKIAGSEVGTRCADRGMSLLGEHSGMVGMGMERYWREAKLYEIGAGTNQIMRNIVVSHLQDPR